MVSNLMNRQYSNRKPDFFAVLVLVVLLGFCLTIAVQIISSESHHVADSHVAVTLNSS